MIQCLRHVYQLTQMDRATTSSRPIDRHAVQRAGRRMWSTGDDRRL